MLRKVGSGAIVFALTAVVLRPILGESTAGVAVTMLLALAAAVYAGMKFDIVGWVNRISGYESSPPPAGRIRVFGGEITRPTFLDNAPGMFAPDRRDPHPAYWENTKGQVRMAGIKPLRRSPLNEQRMLESMIESARYLRAKRGLPLTDRVGNISWPPILPDGLLIEELENDDGSTSRIIATGLTTALDQAEWREAIGWKIGADDGSWNTRPFASAGEYKLQSGHWEKFDNPQSAGVMPLFHLKLREVIVPAASSATRREAEVGVDIPADLPRG